MMFRRMTPVLALGMLTACNRPQAADAPGAIAIDWTAKDTTIGTASWRGQAEAGWCEAERRLTVFAMRGDTGAALLLVLPSLAPVDSIPLVAATDTSRSPRATVAVRWSGERSLTALASGSGTLVLTRVTPTLAGRFEAILFLPDSEASRPSLRGRLEDIPVATGEAGCRLARVSPAPDSGVP
jgi:hypothetical protein